MKWVLVLVMASGGCDTVFSLDFPDAAPASMIDALPARCPAIGMTPQFARVLHQVGTQYCWDYTISATANVAMASCAPSQINEGPLDTELSPAGLATNVDHSRLTPEGDELIARTYNITPIYGRYRKVNGVWARQADLSFGLNALFVSTPTRGPTRRIVVVDTAYSLHELISDGNDGWVTRESYSPAQLGVRPGPVALTADGLRLVTSPQTGDEEYVLWYADRASVDDRFSSVRPLTTAPASKFATYLTEDCGKLYVTVGEAGAINTGVFYAPQL